MNVMNVTNAKRGIFAFSPHLSTIHENEKINTTPRLGLMAWILSVDAPSDLFRVCITYRVVVHLDRVILWLSTEPEDMLLPPTHTENPDDVPWYQHPEMPPANEAFDRRNGKWQSLGSFATNETHSLNRNVMFFLRQEPSLFVSERSRKKHCTEDGNGKSAD